MIKKILKCYSLFVVASAETPKCTDTKPRDTCQYWKKQGYCTTGTYQKYMKNHCCASCGEIDGAWSNWTSNGDLCSKTCGGGSLSGSRTCNNPAPSNGGKTCPGASDTNRPCNEELCPVKVKCTDTKPHCSGWQGAGYCTEAKFVEYMKEYCCASCGAKPCQIEREKFREMPGAPLLECNTDGTWKRLQLRHINGNIEHHCVDSNGKDKDCGCSMEMDHGDGWATSGRYYFDSEKEKCKIFDYGGWGGNDNRFETKDECERTCLQSATPRM